MNKKEQTEIPKLEEFGERLGQKIYGRSKRECVEKGICIDCGQVAAPRCYSPTGLREYRISGLCELCFDRAVGEGGDE